MILNFLCHCFLLASVAVGVTTGLQFCTYSLDCTLFANCVDGFCRCFSGYTTDFYSFDGKLYCTEDSSYYIVPVVIPIVVVGVITIIVSIVIYCVIKRRRLAHAAETTVWVQYPQVVMGVPIANAQAYPTAYPPAYQQVYPGGYQGYQQNQPVSSGGQTGGQGHPNNPQPNQPLITSGQTSQGYTQPTQPSISEYK